MSQDDKDYIALVEKARAGDKESLTQIVEEATVRLHQFVYRQTLQEDLTKDVVQETIVEMLQVFNKLKHVDRFWYWLYGIAYNKLRRQYSKRKRNRAASLSDIPYEVESRKGDETVANAVTDELRQIVVEAMQSLDPRHRSIITMRCYDQMSYAEIANLMDCTEFGARALFYRAKKSLAKKLSAYGLGKGAMLTALLVFGKFTAVNEASAASLVVSAGSLEVGGLAATAAVVTSKAAIVTMTTGVLITGGVAISPLNPLRSSTPVIPVVAPMTSTLPVQDGKHQYFFPDGAQGAVMLRTESREKEVETRWGVLQNAIGNHQWIGDEIQLNNHHWFREDLSVLRLPTDSEKMASFLKSMDGVSTYTEPVRGSGKDLLVICGDVDRMGTQPIDTVRHHNVLLEDYFKAYAPQGVTFTDNRDPMRRRGWTYVDLRGKVHAQTIRGNACLPFVYAKTFSNRPWLNLSIGSDWKAIDTDRGASLGSTRYAAGTFFQGLMRPWQGLHVMDTIRRDAAEMEMPFTTERLSEDEVQITVEQDGIALVYTVDLYDDLLLSIDFMENQQNVGSLRFDYHQEMPRSGNRYAKPSVAKGQISDTALGMKWLFNLVSEMNASEASPMNN